MATSSILENIRVNNPNAIEQFVESMENSKKTYHKRTDDEKSAVITDPEQIQNFVKKCLQKKGER